MNAASWSHRPSLQPRESASRGTPSSAARQVVHSALCGAEHRGTMQCTWSGIQFRGERLKRGPYPAVFARREHPDELESAADAEQERIDEEPAGTPSEYQPSPKGPAKHSRRVQRTRSSLPRPLVPSSLPSTVLRSTRNAQACNTAGQTKNLESKFGFGRPIRKRRLEGTTVGTDHSPSDRWKDAEDYRKRGGHERTR